MNDIQEHKDLLPPRILFHTPHGVGKTTFGATAIKPIFACTEKGLGNIMGAKMFPFIDSFQGMVDAISFMFGDHPFKTFVIDSVDWLEPLIFKQVCSEFEGKNNIEDFGYGKGYKYAVDKWIYLLGGLTKLQENRKISIILLSHSEIKRFDSPEVDPFDRYQPKIHTTASAKIQEWADIVLFGNFKTTIKETETGFNKKVRRGDGAGARIIYTEERPAFYAKNRYQLPPSIPFPKEGAHKMILDWILKGIEIENHNDTSMEDQQQPENNQQPEQQQTNNQQQTPSDEWNQNNQNKF